VRGGRHLLSWSLVQWLRLALSKGPNGVGVFPPSPKDGNRSSFWNVVFYSLEYQTMEKSKKPSNPVWFISAFYSNAISRNECGSEKLLCCFYTLKRKTKQRKPSQVSKYIFNRNIKLPLFCTCSFIKSSFTWSLSFDIGHTSQFSKQSPQIICPWLIGGLQYTVFYYAECGKK
jgi:hypothetical protein